MSVLYLHNGIVSNVKITIISVGTKPDSNYLTLIESYTKRLPDNIQLNWKYIKSGPSDVQTSMRKESESILRAIPKKSRIILLDETGQQKTSTELAIDFFGLSKDVTFIIGGSHGVHNDVKAISDYIWSLGKLVFPHQLVRLILTEQIYRAYSISIDHPYHHK